MRVRLLILVTAVALLTGVVGAEKSRKKDAAFTARGGAGTFAFALIGDVPYDVAPSARDPRFDRLVNDVNHQRKLAFVAHVGDIKAGTTECSDNLYFDRLDRFNRFRRPFVLTPGDNDWTDCHLSGYAPLERLGVLRSIFFPIPGATLGRRRMRVESQASTPGYEEFVENVQWTYRSIAFATLHIVGSSNGRSLFPGRDQNDADEVARRDAANLYWLHSVFDRAEQAGHRGVVIMMQANPAPDREFFPRAAYAPVVAALEARVAAYRRPVVLVNGDSHYFRVDKPSFPTLGFLPNFTRVEVFGDSRVHWVRVNVDPASEQVFTFSQEIVDGNQ